MKILIVEDHKDHADALCRLLTKRMETVDCKIVCTLDEGLRESIDFQADVTLLDLCLPGSSIHEVISSIPKFPPPVIVVTDIVDDDQQIQLECFAFRAQSFISKGILGNILANFPSQIEGDKLVSAIINAHFRTIMPSKRAEFEQYRSANDAER